MINALMTINERVKKTVSFKHVLRVSKFLDDVELVSDISFRIKVGSMVRFVCLYNLVAGVLVFVMGIFLFWLSLSNGLLGMDISMFLCGVLFLPIGIYMIIDGLRLVSVKHINKALEQYCDSRESAL
ncbi:hypothetical protein THF1C08_690001 [Vibrio jasicida]|uniref:DUF4282 domain-containing protein n=1 Tax=Vibrio jasicida TaxID=766224 RepID=A0AAU9QX49_9VIBR|nr:hypothetical protein THF1C08_690001 [Vibrio jasicida]CAH1603552.1 hypothetical protein THF1A12_710001 [Vibrio jasicida]